ncbi:MAG: GIY-YIG nuclease family protein [Cyclobacteriaceae bacterium]|nr:GIY-YIG nuclease family protein [Cyclobacteriaceae bacterium]
MGKKRGYVYIMSNSRRTVLYVGVTSDLEGRMRKHKTKFYTTSFSARYNVDRLVYIEEFDSIVDAIAREKQLKAGPRWRKEKLINALNPNWDDLALSRLPTRVGISQ